MKRFLPFFCSDHCIYSKSHNVITTLNVLSRKNICKVVFILSSIFFLLQLNASAQTTVFSDNFNSGTLNAAYTVVHEPSTSQTMSDNGSVLDAHSNGTKGCVYAEALLSSFASPFNPTLSSNPGLVTWTFNLSANTASTGGVFGIATNTKAIGVILVTSSSSPLTSGAGSGNGYALVNIGNNGSKEWDLVSFTGGIGGTTTTMASFSSSVQKTWVDIKITYDPSTNTWTYYFHDEANTGSTPNQDPATYAYSSNLTKVDATYTGTAMTAMAFGMSYSSTSGNDYLFDNFTCTVLNSCSAAITGQPSSPAAVCSGAGSASFTVTATGATGYQWQEGISGTYTNITNGGVYSGATTATLTLTNPTAAMTGYTYRAVVNGCATSNGAATLTINSPPSITTQPSSPAAVCSGAGTAVFSVTATGATGYQWQESTTGSGGTFNNITNGGIYSGATTATLTLTNATSAMSGYAYRVVASGTCTPAATSNGLALLSFTTSPTITTQPSSSSTICAGAGSANFTVVASGGGTLTYVWKESTDGGVTFPTTLTNTGVYSGTGTATLTITNPPVTMNGRQYEVIVSNCSGNITTNGLAVLNVANGGTVTVQPVNTTENPGGTANFSVTATGAGLNYQWQYSATGVAGSFANVSNGTPANFTYTNATTNVLTVATTTGVTASTSGLYYYQCLVIGGCTVTTSSANLKVINPDPATSSISPATVTEGNGTFTITVNGTNFVGGAGYTSPSVVYWNGVALTTTYVSSTQLTASVPAANVASGKAGTYPITVVNSGANNTTSNSQTFTVTAVGTGRICAASSPWVFTIDNTGSNTGTNFTSFTAAINDLNSACASIRNHPVTFNVKAGQTFNETPPAITVAPAASSANYILFQTDGSSATHPLIQPAAGTSGSTDPIVTIKGTNYIIFNGVDLKSTDATIDIGYYLITNTNTSSATIGAQYNTIKNCVVTLNSANAKATYGILQSGSGGTANIGNDYNAVTVYSSFYGIVLSGNSSVLDNSDTVQYCIIGPSSSGTNNLGGSLSSQDYGIGALNQNGVVINNNTVENVSLSTGKEVDGIFVTGSGTGTISVYLNKIHDISGTSTSSSNAVYGIHVQPAGNSTTNIFSNCVSSINAAASTSSRVVAGIDFDSQGSAGNNAIGNVYFNSIWLSGNYSCGVSAFYTTGANTSLNVKDNIFKYSGTQINSSNKAYCIYLASGASVLSSEDYNIYDMISFTSPYFTGNSSGDIGILTAWKNATGKDVNSQQFFTQFVSVTDLHLSDYPSTSYTGLLADVSAINPSADIDGQARTTPTIGADEVPVTTAPIVVISAPSQPAEANIAKANSGQLIGQYSLAAYAATSGANAQPIFNGLTLTVRTTAPVKAANTDFSNFKLTLYDASTFTNIGTIATYTPTISFNAYGDATIPFNFTTNYDLSGGDVYYLYVTCDVSAGAVNGSNIYVDSSYASSFSFSPDAGVTPVTKIAPTVIDTAGRQTVCTFYYNTATLDNFNIVNNPALITTNVDDLNAWRAKKTDDGIGMGGMPPNFTDDYQVFNIILNGATFTTPATSWALSGGFSKAIVGDGVKYVTFTVPAGNSVGDTVDVMSHGILQLYPTPLVSSALSLGTLADSSTVEFSSNSSQTIPVANYGNLKFDGSGNRIFSAGTTGIKDSFELAGYTGASITTTSSTINFNGTTAAQVIPGYNHNNLVYNNLTVSNTSGFTTQIGENSAVAESVYVDGILTNTKNLIVPQQDSIILTANVTAVSAASGLLQVNGAIVSNAFGSIYSTSTATLQFNNNSIFRLATAATTNSPTAAIPIAKWIGGSICRITGIIGQAGNDYTGLDGNYQAFGIMVVDCPDLVGKMLLTNATFGGFSADTLIIENTGSRAAGHTGYVQIPREKVQETVNVINYRQESGYVTVAQGISGNGSRILNVSGSFTVYDSINAVYPSKFEIMNTTHTNSPPWYGKVNVGGNFYMAPTSTLKQGTGVNPSTQQATADLVFNGSSGNQTATFGIISGDINFEVNKAQVSGGGDTVKLQTNATADSFYLTKGVFSIGSNTLTVNGPVSRANSPGSGTFAGSVSSNLTIGSTGYTTAAGSLFFANNTAGSPYNNYLINLTLNNGATATLGNALNIAAGSTSTPGVVSVGSSPTGVLTTGSFLTLKSDANGTARVAANSSGSTYVSGNVVIERYINSAPSGSYTGRGWRLLTGPVSTAQSINSSWQEGLTNTTTSGAGQHIGTSGYGTEITNLIATNPLTTGYDKAVTDNPSLLFLNNGSWTSPSSTTGTTSTTGNVSNGSGATSQQGYMVFIRGDRSVVVTTPPFNTATATTLRCTGSLNQGTVNYTPASTGYKVIGNPYASETSLNNFFSSYNGIVGQNYVIWDPKYGGSNGVGGFCTVTWNNASPYLATAHVSTFNLGSIESSQAFLLNFSSVSAVTFNETDKAAQSALIFRPADNIVPAFAIALNSIEADGSASLDDGALTIYGNQYSDSVNWLEDAQKIPNPGENLAIIRYGKLMAIEKRPLINIADTTFLSITHLRQATNYEFAFVATDLNDPNLSARLEDKFLGTSTALSLTDTTKVDFTITSDPASQGASRFRIVFGPPQGGPLPVTYTSLKAWQQNKNISMQWNVTNEMNVKEYVIERSTDGHNFTAIATVNATGASVYDYLDTKASDGNNYYRIRSTGSNGAVQYSQIVKVNIGSFAPAMAAYPNPVKAGMIGLQFTNQPKGIYTVKLSNASGQQLMNQSILHPGGSGIQTIRFNRYVSKEIYMLEVTGPDKAITAFKIMTE